MAQQCAVTVLGRTKKRHSRTIPTPRHTWWQMKKAAQKVEKEERAAVRQECVCAEGARGMSEPAVVGRRRASVIELRTRNQMLRETAVQQRGGGEMNPRGVVSVQQVGKGCAGMVV